jgi:hypothetical protein
MTDSTRGAYRAVAVWALQLGIAGIAWVLVWFRVISIPHCGMTCDSGLLTSTSTFYFWTCVAVVCLTGAAIIVFRNPRWAWLVPMTGIILIVAGAAIANRLSDVALGFS